MAQGEYLDFRVHRLITRLVNLNQVEGLFNKAETRKILDGRGVENLIQLLRCVLPASPGQSELSKLIHIISLHLDYDHRKLEDFFDPSREERNQQELKVKDAECRIGALKSGSYKTLGEHIQAMSDLQAAQQELKEQRALLGLIPSRNSVPAYRHVTQNDLCTMGFCKKVKAEPIIRYILTDRAKKIKRDALETRDLLYAGLIAGDEINQEILLGGWKRMKQFLNPKTEVVHSLVSWALRRVGGGIRDKGNN